MGRVLFTPKSEPEVDWSEIETRLQEISAGARPTDLPVDASVTLANDLATANDPTLTNDAPVTSDPPAINRGDPLAEMLSLLGEGAVSRLPRQDIQNFRWALRLLLQCACGPVRTNIQISRISRTK